MGLEERIMPALKEAMLAKDEKTVRSLRAIKAAILVVKTAGGGSGALSPEEEIKLLQKLVKQRRDSLEIFRQRNREDLAKREEEEITVIEQFLPAQLSEEELRAEIQDLIAETGVSDPSKMGMLIGMANKRLAGRAEGKAISQMVKSVLGA